MGSKLVALIALTALMLVGCGGGTRDAQPPATSATEGSPHIWQNVANYLGHAAWPNGASPAIDVQPADDSVTSGTSKTFTVHATGTAPLAYQWMRGGVTIPGATGSSYTFDPSFGDDGTSFTVTVTNAAGQATSRAAVLTVTAAVTTALVGACKEITSPGAYRLFVDVSAKDSTPCISIHDTHDVQLDCGGHTIARNVATQGEALSISNVQDFSVKNCTVVAYWLNVTRSSNGSFTNNVVATASDAVWQTAIVNVVHASLFTFDGNTVQSGTYQQAYGDRNTISRNHMTSSAGTNAGSANIVSNLSTGTRILANIIDGSSTGGALGMDDGIALQDESDIAIEDNDIRNTWDCGIEFTGTIAAASVRRNHIANTAVAGIGGWYWLSLSGSTFSDNTVERSPSLFLFQRFFGLRPAGWDEDHLAAADTAVRFSDNAFERNTLVDPLLFYGQYQSASLFQVTVALKYGVVLSSIAGERLAAPSDFQLSNNTFTGNDFGHTAESVGFGIYDVLPADMVVDGGGNVCKPFPVDNYPLVCH